MSPLIVFIVIWLILRILMSCLIWLGAVWAAIYDITMPPGIVPYAQLIAAGCAVYLTASIVLDILSIIKLLERDIKGKIFTIANSTVLIIILLAFVAILENSLALYIPILCNGIILISALILELDTTIYSAPFAEPVFDYNENLPYEYSPEQESDEKSPETAED